MTRHQYNKTIISGTLYENLKNYIEEPLNKKWIINSQSPNSLSVVTVR